MNTNLNHLSDDDLLESAKHAAREERRCTERVIEHLHEVERRRLFARRGYSSLWEYVVNELGYDGGAAQRRIQAMRLSKSMPEIKDALREEKVSLTSAAMLQSFFEGERRHQNKSYTPEQKRDVLKKIEGLSSRETEKVLREISPQALPRERARVLTPTETEIRFVADAQMIEMISRMKVLLSGRHPNPSLEEVFRKALSVALERMERSQQGRTKGLVIAQPDLGPEKPGPAQLLAANSEITSGRSESVQAKGAETTYLPTPARRWTPVRTKRSYLPLPVKRTILTRADHRCTYVDSDTGRRCTAIHNLQIEHVRPVALGGTNDPANLTVLCGQHNRLTAERTLGPWTRKFVNRT